MSEKTSRELPSDRLATSDQRGNRIYLYPAEVKGRFRNYRSLVHGVLIFLFLLLPWIRIGGHQAVLLNVIQRRFSIFGLTFWAHDAPMLVFVFGGAALTLGFLTAVWGRVWCGWACPQTVFIDSVFRKIEVWIEGDHVARKKLDVQPWTAEKLYKKSLKWGLFLVFTLVLTHSFLAYFVGTETLAEMMVRPPSESIASFSVMLGISALILFDFGWFREQFCTVLCPYGRFQSLLMDEHSMIVAYDVKRGEPRKGLEPPEKAHGDCVNCYRCVQVCPTGIDIRRGTQLECIGCTACMDACDDVMTRIHKPLGLVRYASALSLQGGRAKLVRGRTAAYAILIIFIVSAMALTVLKRQPLSATVTRAIGAPFQVISNVGADEIIANRFKVDLNNQSFDNIPVVFKSDAVSSGVSVVTSQNPLLIKAGERAAADLFLTFPKKLLKDGKLVTRILIQKEGVNSSESFLSQEVTLVGPYQ